MFNCWFLTPLAVACFPTHHNTGENTLITKAANPAAFKSTPHSEFNLNTLRAPPGHLRLLLCLRNASGKLTTALMPSVSFCELWEIRVGQVFQDSSVQVNGVNVRRPGTYGDIDLFLLDPSVTLPLPRSLVFVSVS